MTKHYGYKAHFISLSVLFFLGEAVLLLPTKNSGEFTALGLVLSGVIAFLLLFMAVPVANLSFSQNTKSSFKKFIACFLLAAVAVAASLCGANCFNAFFGFATEILLPKTPRIFIILIFSLVAFYLALKPQEVFLKFSLLAFAVVVITVLILTFSSLSNYNIENIYIYSLPSVKELFKATNPYLRLTSLPVLLLPFFESAVLGRSRVKSQFGVILGFALLGTCIISSVLVFGFPLAGEFGFPYSSAVSTAALGRLFTRIDGFVYMIYFISAIVKTAVCIVIVNRALKRINEILK